MQSFQLDVPLAVGDNASRSVFESRYIELRMQLRSGSLFGFAAFLISFSAIAQTTAVIEAVDDQAVLGIGGRVVIPALRNDVSGPGKMLKKIGKPKFGVAVSVPDPKHQSHESAILYIAGPQFSGHDTFQYTIMDDTGAVSSATVTVHGPQFAIIGPIGTNIVDPAGKPVGYLELEVRSAGVFTGKVRIGTAEYSLLGNFDRSGRYIGFARSEEKHERLPVSFIVTTETERALLSGTIGDDEIWTVSQEIGSLSAAQFEELDGRYTVELPAPSGTVADSNSGDGGGGGTDSNGRDIPQGSGWMMIEVNEHGEARLKGKTGDGRSFSVKGQVMGDAGSPVLSFYEAWGDSVLAGALRMGESIDGDLFWTRDVSDEDRYPDGFDLTVNARGGRYEAPKSGKRALDHESSDGGRATLTISGGGVDEFTRELRFTEGDKVTTLDQDGDAIDLEIDRENGTFKGKFRDPDDRETRVKFSGVLLQSEGRGVGFFEANTKTGSVKFEAKGTDDNGGTDSPDNNGDGEDGSEGDDLLGEDLQF